MALAVGDDRRLEVDVGGRALVVEAFGQLECAFDVLARSLEVASPPITARAPRKDVGAQLVGRNLRALGHLECLVEEPDRRLDAVELVASDAEPEEHVGAFDIREGCALAEDACALEQRNRLANVAGSHPYRGFTGQRTRLELRHARRQNRRADALELLEGFFVPTRFQQCLRARKSCIDTSALVGRDTVGQEARVHAEPLGDPVDRLAGRAGLAALDLTHVLLGEPVARQIRLSHSGGNAEVTQALAESQPGLRGGGPLLLTDGGRVRHSSGSRRHASPNVNLSFSASPEKVMFGR